MLSRSRKAALAGRFLLILLAVWAACNWGTTIYRITQLYVTIPTWDYWRVAEFATDMRAFDFRYLWLQHNEHRILGPDIVFALDLLLFHARRILPIVVSFVCYFGSWVLLARSLASDQGNSFDARGWAIALAGIMIGWRGSALVLADPFLLQWTLMEFAFLLALWLLTRQTLGPPVLVSAIAAGVTATYSSGNGLLVWPVLVLAAYVAGCKKRDVGILAASGVVADGLYFVAYRFGGNLHLANLFLHPVYTIAFVASYLSMPFGGMKSPQFGVYLGLCNLAGMLLLFSAAWRGKLLRSRTGIFLFGSYLFTILTALLTAAGRMEPGDTFYTGAKAPRYVVLLMVNWGVSAAAPLWISARREWRVVSAPILTVLLSVLMALGFLKLRWWERTGIRPYVDAQVTELSLRNGLRDPRLLRNIFPSPEFVEHYLKILRADGLSIFSGEPTGSYSSSGGQVTRVFPLQSGVEIVGWTRGNVNRVAIVNGNDEVIGTGRRLPLGLPTELLTSDTPPALAWIAFVPARSASGRFSVRGGDSPAREMHSFPQVAVVSESQVGANIPGIAWRKDPAWTADGEPPMKLPGPTPRGAVYGSWSNANSQLGEIQSTGITLPDGCLILPVLHGPSAKPLTVEVRDAVNGITLQSIPMQDEDIQWEFWRVPILTANPVRIVASDQGKGMGEWLAVAAPAHCK